MTFLDLSLKDWAVIIVSAVFCSGMTAIILTLAAGFEP